MKRVKKLVIVSILSMFLFSSCKDKNSFTYNNLEKEASHFIFRSFSIDEFSMMEHLNSYFYEITLTEERYKIIDYETYNERLNSFNIEAHKNEISLGRLKKEDLINKTIIEVPLLSGSGSYKVYFLDISTNNENIKLNFLLDNYVCDTCGVTADAVTHLYYVYLDNSIYDLNKPIKINYDSLV